MSDLEDWSNQRHEQQQQQQRPAIQSRQSHSSIQSIARKPLSPTAMTSPSSAPHRRKTSDNASIFSQSQAEHHVSLDHHVSSVSAELHHGGWMPSGTGPSSPLIEGHEDDVYLGSSDLGSSFNTSRSKPKSSQINPRERPPAWHHSPPVPNPSGRPKPTPMQFVDNTSNSSPAGSFASSTVSPRSQFQHGRVDSRAHLLNTPSSSDWTRTPRTPTAYPALIAQKKKWWRWRPAWAMYVFFAFGVCCAVGHHLFYSAFNGRPADNLIVMLRYGTILAFAAKAGLAAAAITAFRQRIWTTVRSKLLSVAALDSLFAATEDLAALLNLEIYKSATLAMVLAVFIWLTPLVIILTSNTLTVELAFFEEKGMCPGVKTLNFTMESLENWRLAKKINGLFGISTSLYNTTATNISDPYWFDYYTGPSMGFAQVATLGMFSQQAMQPKDAGLEICGPGWNCTYVVNFTAPGYQCSDIASGVNSRMNKLGNNTAPFDTSILLPEGNFSYYAYTSGGDYSPTQLKPEYIDVGGVPIGIEPPWPHHFGALRTEPILWIGHSVRTNKTDPTPNNRTEPGWDDAFTPKIFACEHYETHYTVSFNWTGGQQFSNVMKREYLKPVIDTTFIPSVKAMDGTNDNTTAYPESNYWYPSADQTEMQPYRRVAAFHSIGAVLRDFINGTVNSESILNPIAVGKAIQTKVLDPRSEYFPHSELAPIIQEVYEDVILSMFSDPRFLAIVWAQKPWEKSGTLPGDESTAYPCNRSRDVVVYKYVARDLWIVYSLAFVFSMIAIGLGTAAVLENEGVLRNTRFSSIVAATRGPALERVMWREERGDVPRDIKNLKVGYGIVHRANALGVTEDTRYPERTLWDGGEIRYGFGLEGDVRQVK